MFIPYRHFERSRIDCKHPKSAEYAERDEERGREEDRNEQKREARIGMSEGFREEARIMDELANCNKIPI
jgi:predicted transposase YdaD